MKRRQFLRSAAAGLAAAGSLACSREEGRAAVSQEAKRERSRVALVRRKPTAGGEEPPARLLREMLEKALVAATGATSAREALRGLFSPGDVVGIKLNCLAGPPLSPRPVLCRTLAELLEQIGVTPGNIIFFERSQRDLERGGFTPGGPGPRFWGHDTPGVGYTEQLVLSGQVGSLLSRVVAERATALVSFGVLKDHNLAGVGGCMKNFYGIIHNPNKYHDNNCDPYVADVWALPAVRKKFRLAIVDGITAQCHGGPGYLPGFAWPFGGVLAARDPVALDRQVALIVDERRRSLGLPSLAEDKREPRWLRTAASRGLGRDDPRQIELVGG